MLMPSVFQNADLRKLCSAIAGLEVARRLLWGEEAMEGSGFGI